jgi:prepilin-type N-terminal cleavage/methylation domain-containing protein
MQRVDIEPCSGFTLVELLVVVAIIGILISMIIPSVGGALQSAKTVQCSSNLKQIGQALMSYVAEDGEGHYPPKGIPGVLSSVFTWVGAAGAPPHYDKATADLRYLNKFLGVREPDAPCPVARCPSEPGSALYALTGSSYGSNTNPLEPFSAVDEAGDPIAAAWVDRPARFVVMADHGANGMVWGAREESWHRPRGGDPTFTLLYADVHVDTVPVRFREWLGEEYTYRYK